MGNLARTFVNCRIRPSKMSLDLHLMQASIGRAKIVFETFSPLFLRIPGELSRPENRAELPATFLQTDFHFDRICQTDAVSSAEYLHLQG